MRFGLPDRSKLHQTEERGYALLVAGVLAIVVFGFIPTLIVMVIGLVEGTSGGEAFTANDQYPGFTVLSPLMVLPALLIAASLVITFHLPLKDMAGLNRSEIALAAFVGAVVCLVVLGLDRAFLSDTMGLFVSGVVALYFVVWIVAVMRIAVGWLRLVPDTWRSEDARRMRDASKGMAGAKGKRR